MVVFDIIFVIFIGLVFGSFATALSYRLPREISIIKKARSSCVSCSKDLEAPDLVPIFSWVFLKGKCRFCKEDIGVRYPLIELSTLLLCGVFYMTYGVSIATLPIFVLAPILVAMIDIDLNYKIIPDGLNFTILFLGVLFLFSQSLLYVSPLTFLDDHTLNIVGGFLIYGLGSLALRHGATLVLKREAMGLGDIKFFAAIGVWLGSSLETLSWFLFMSGIIGVIFAIVWKKIKNEDEFPFGPALIFAFILILCIKPIVYG